MSDSRNKTTVVQIRMALSCLVIALLGGAVGVLHYIPSVSTKLQAAGLGLTKLRPLHTTFASLWIYGAAIAVIYHYLGSREGGLGRGDLRRFWFHTVCWIASGIGIVVTLFLGIYSGREYLGFHPVFSVLFLAGWLALARNFLPHALRGFWRQPIYIYFWTVGILYFMYTFVEGHAYLLPWVQDHPVRDIALHWKACGTLVGSFNFLVYGSLIYVSEQLSGDKRYGQSTVAFALFGVGCLNSFTNFAHHTYHLPQSHIVKWVAFVVSMTEIVLLLRLLFDIAASLRQRAGAGAYDAAKGFLVSAKWWTASMLTVSVLISVPSLNSLVHGTHVVTGHAMGTEFGIDSMVLFGSVTFLLTQAFAGHADAHARLHNSGLRAHIAILNGAAALLVTWLTVSGTVHGVTRYLGEPTPTWVETGRLIAFPAAGAVLALALVALLLRWAPLLGPRPASEPIADPAAV